MKKYLSSIALMLTLFCACAEKYDPIIPIKPEDKSGIDSVYMSRAEITFEKIFNLYWSNKVDLFFSSHPNSLGTPQEPTAPQHDIHAYLWGVGGLFSAFNAIVQNTNNLDFRLKYESDFKRTLIQYYNASKTPPAYACFVFDFDGRLYDDAIWIGIDLVDLYSKTKDSWYLEYAKTVWDFVLSGMDDTLGGGVYWDENSKDSKNTCSNAPAIVLGMKLFKATNEDSYLETCEELYTWVKKTLQDPADYLYWDNIKINGTIETPKFSYNSGQMIQAGVLLYNATKNTQYLNDAKLVAEACYNYFFENFTSTHTGEQFRIIKNGNLWFNAIMIRGFVELNKVEANGIYTTAIKKSLEHGWKYARDTETGLFNNNLSGNEVDNNKDILIQGAAVELYARMAVK